MMGACLLLYSVQFKAHTGHHGVWVVKAVMDVEMFYLIFLTRYLTIFVNAMDARYWECDTLLIDWATYKEMIALMALLHLESVWFPEKFIQPWSCWHCASFFSQSVSGTCGSLVTAQMRSGRSRRLAPQRLTNRWTLFLFFVLIWQVEFIRVEKLENCWLCISSYSCYVLCCNGHGFNS